MRLFNKLLLPVILILYGLTSTSWANNKSQEIKINHIGINVEIADTSSSRQTGLMFRTELAENNGMLFIFPDNSYHCFWMKNTLLPLSIAFIDKNNTIVDIEEMQARSLDSHCPSTKVNKALEMNSGWFNKNNVKIGDRLILD